MTAQKRYAPGEPCRLHNRPDCTDSQCDIWENRNPSTAYTDERGQYVHDKLNQSLPESMAKNANVDHTAVHTQHPATAQALHEAWNLELR